MTRLARVERLEAEHATRNVVDRTIDVCNERYAMFYDWQREFIASTNTNNASCLCAANRIGKTFTGTFIDAVHLMGIYPDD